MAETTEDAFIGRTVAEKYKIEALLGRGAMGAVYRARQTVLKRNVAIKVLNPGQLDDSAFAARFKREAKTASMFEHVNSLRILDFGQEPDGLLYLVMEFIDGRDLLRLMREDWPLADVRVVDILSQALAALAVAHDEGILHRDLKPENIMVVKGKDDEGRPTELVKVCDFGIAKVLEKRGDGTGDNTMTQTGTLTAHGMLVGTPEYMSPEHIKNEPLDGRSDLYSLGVMLYQMLTGRLPFQAASAIKLVIKHVDEIPARPSEVYPRVNPALEAICLKALAKQPDARYANAREMRAELRAVVGNHEAGARAGAVDGPLEGAPSTRRHDAKVGSNPSVSVGASVNGPPSVAGTRLDSTQTTKRAALAASAAAAPRSVAPIVVAIVIATAAICAALLYSR